MANAVIYTRFSPRPDAAECDSCAKQQERCAAYCQQQGYTIKGSHNDENVSGGALDRPGLAKALGDLSEGCILVVDTPDRLARDLLIGLTIRHEVQRRGASVEYANGSPSGGGTPEGKLFANILAAFAAYERDRVRFATSRGIKRRQANGEWFGRPPVGWQKSPDGQLVKHPGEQAAIRLATKLSRDGWPSYRIAGLLNLECAPFRGGEWKPRTVRRILQKTSQGTSDAGVEMK